MTWVAIVVVAGLGFWWWQQSGAYVTTSDVDDLAFGNDNIFLSEFQGNQLVESPLVLSGEAIGPWYFEASFPIELKDGNGLVIADTIGEAQGDWMVNTFVPFTATLTFATPATPSGTLILHKENPSGEPAYDDELIIPITF